MEKQKQQHFVLIHGACHGAWCWFKLKPLLESAGHQVTALDLSASGINLKMIEEIYTFEEYSLPLLEFMASLPASEKVILVGHSLGGLNIALASDKFPDKVLVAIFLTAFMPDCIHSPSYPLDLFFEQTSAEEFMDTEFKSFGTPERAQSTMFFGTQLLASKAYQLTSTQDLELAKFLVRPSSTFVEDLSKANPFSKEGYGSVKRAYIICAEDLGLTKEFQSMLIERVGVSIVKELKDTDHMAMLCKPRQLCQALKEITDEITTSCTINP
ncbi:OLC1v1010049C1 [Oldenlandia corymbosa var. corymbosa]|uniref:OLC1v1010049C1 n=1 Tax=Oldenlandia corymbosa var. corymbosa TaxID=529605 RepID=A0AAV1DTC5_OLDCO|nr:OLC1v1010049C1 [Oldenlandia corymbosa var. corymbosa]